MICYEPLWRTMRSRNVTTYTLREKHRISHATVQRLQANLPVSTYTLDRLCRILDCRLDESQYMCRTRSRKARNPMKCRIRELLGDSA